MKKILLTAFLFYSFTAYAQMMPPPEPVYSEVYTVAECLNSYEGTTCIVTGNISLDNNAYHRDNNGNVTGGTFKITGELRGANHRPDVHRPKKHHHNDPHIAARYIKRQ